MKPIDARRLAAVDPAAWYGAGEVGALFGKTARACRCWCRAGKLASRRHPTDPGQFLVLGADVLALAGDLARAAHPAESETARARADRGAAHLAEILKLKKARA